MKTKKILSLLVAMTMLFSCVGITAMAEETVAEDTTLEPIVITKYYNDEVKDLNGGTLVVKAQIIANSGTVTLKNGTIDASQIEKDMNEPLFRATGKLILENVTIKADSEYKIKYLFAGYDDVTIRNSIINAANVEYIAYGDDESDSVKVTLDNTKLYMTSGCSRIAGTGGGISFTVQNGSLIDADELNDRCFRNTEVVIDNSTVDVDGCENFIKNDNGSKITVRNGSTLSIDEFTDTNGAIISTMNASASCDIKVNGVIYTSFTEIEDTLIPVAKIGETSYATLADAFAAAQNGDEVVITAAGTYSVPSGKSITVTGVVDDVVFDNIGAHSMGSANVTFNNVTFDYYPNVIYTGLQHSGDLVYNNCTFEGQVFLYGNSETFNKCTFNQNSSDDYNVWTYGAKEVKFNECEFNSAGKSVLVYNEGGPATKLNVEKTAFKASATVAGKAAIEIDTSLMPSGTKIVVDSETTATGFATDTKSGSSLWNDKKVDSTQFNGGTTSVVIVAGETVKDSKENAPKGTITPAYTTTGTAKPIWGEATSNSKESFVIELYDDEKVIATTRLNNVNGIINGNLKVTWGFWYSASDEYWTTTWTEGYPNASMSPEKVVLYADGVKVAENEVQLNAPDNLKKIVAAAEDKDGDFLGYFTTLTEAMGKFNDRKVVVLRDVEEKIDGMYGCTLSTNVDGGVTIVDTNLDDWIDFDDVVVDKGVTLHIANPFVGDSVSTVKGKLIVDSNDSTLYIGYDGKLIVEDGGSVLVNGSVVNRYHKTENAGIYIYGDGNNDTVEFDCSYYIGSYSGTFYAENANIETGYFLLKNSYDDDSYTDANMKLDSSVITVVGTADTQDSFIIDDKASLTMSNSKIADVRDFNILAGTNLTLSMDESSSISATYMSIAEGVPFEKKENADGTFGVAPEKIMVAKIGDVEYTDLHTAMTSAKAGETVELLSDVDLFGAEWEPVSFKGKFNGNGYKIKNLTINKPGVSNTGFITSLNGTFENVTFENPTVTGGENTGVLAGRAGGSSAYAKDINVTGIIKVETTHTGYARASAIVGGWAYGKYENITVDGTDKAISYIKHTGGGDGRYVAGIVGHADEVDAYINCTVKNITISGGWLCGGIAGPGPSDGIATGCAVENIDMDADYSGGMFGWYYGAGTIENSSVKDVTFTAGSTNNGAIGGYQNNTSATVTNVTIENVKNEDGTPLLSDVAKIGDTTYATLEEALKALTSGATLTLLSDVTIDYAWDERYTGARIEVPATIDGNGKTITFACDVADGGNYHSAFRVHKDVAVEFKNLTIDMSKATNGTNQRIRAISSVGSLTVDGCKFIGNSSLTNTRAIIFGEGSQDNADAKITVTGSTFTNWRTGVTDNENAKDMGTVTVTGSTFTNAGVALSASEAVTFTGNTVTNGYVSITSYTDSENLVVTATENTLTSNVDVKNMNYIDVASKNVNAQKEFFILPIELPTATVTELEKEDLTFALNFKADEASETQLAYYGNWYADYVLTVNKDVTFNADSETSDGYLSGQYDGWNENWVNVPFEDVTLKAGESIKIMAYAAELLNQPGLKFTYREVYEWVKDFNCGVFFTEEFLAKNPDLEVTLELRMYNPYKESESYVIGETYKFEAPEVEEELSGLYVLRNTTAIKREGYEDLHYRVRAYAAIDSLNYKEVGFEYRREGSENYSSSTTSKVYTSRKVTNTTTGKVTTLTPDYIAPDFGKYIFAINIWANASNIKADTNIEIRPYAKRKDGSTMYLSDWKLIQGLTKTK